MDDQRAFSLTEFCRVENFSKSFFYALRKRNLAPAISDIGGLLRITPQARQAWHERMAALAKSEAAQLEAERRRELAVIAGKAAAASPRHISRRGSRPAPAAHRRRGRR
jgi:hypothetical protein